MRRFFFILSLFLVSSSVAFAEIELDIGAGYGSEGAFFHSQFGWKQIYYHSIIGTIDFAAGGEKENFTNLDFNLAYYHKRFAFGVGFGNQWADEEHLYIKPNISFNYKYVKFALETHVFFDKKSPSVALIFDLRDFAALIPILALGAPQVHDTYTVRSYRSGNYIYSTVEHSQVTEADRERYMRNAANLIMGLPEWWGNINLNGGAYK